ncbi:MAG: cyclophilin-like fold protein [Anaerolineae bacterium]|nr:cyclophilin-like fold protein [Anaerolineae bacterium]
MSRIRISAGGVTAEAELNDSPTAQAIWEALPITARGNRWGEEIYFRIPVRQQLADDARADVSVGELGYWPPGNAFCIFFGRTPASVGDEPRAASPVNPIGRVLGDATLFKQVGDGEVVTLTRV